MDNTIRSKWKKAQQSETSSWIDTDMSYERLIKIWKNRLSDFKMITKNLDKNSSVIDIGSGPVSVLSAFPKCKRMIAVDSLNDVYKKKFKQTSYITYLSSQAEKVEYENKSFDAVLCINALDHMENYKVVLNNMMNITKKGGHIFLEYENTSPLAYLLAKLGYKKPLNDFHPILIESRVILPALVKAGYKIERYQGSPQLNWKKVVGIFKIVTGQNKISTYERRISIINYGLSRTIFHYATISIELFLYLIFPKKFSYFTQIIAKRRK